MSVLPNYDDQAPVKENLEDCLLEEALDDLKEEHLLDWILDRLDKDRGKSLSEYRTSLFTFYVDYEGETVLISAELGGCHPPDRYMPLLTFQKVLQHEVTRQPYALS